MRLLLLSNEKGAKYAPFLVVFALVMLNNILNYLITLATTPAPTVRPPSRIAKRKPSAIAIG
jgi:hypothetical protein